MAMLPRILKMPSLDSQSLQSIATSEYFQWQLDTLQRPNPESNAPLRYPVKLGIRNHHRDNPGVLGGENARELLTDSVNRLVMTWYPGANGSALNVPETLPATSHYGRRQTFKPLSRE